MNRSRYIPRDFEGDGEFVEALEGHLASLREFGGEVRIVADRVPTENERTKAREFVTIGYLVGYNEKTKVKNIPEEPDAPLGAAPPEPVPESAAAESNGTAEPELAEAA